MLAKICENGFPKIKKPTVRNLHPQFSRLPCKYGIPVECRKLPTRPQTTLWLKLCSAAVSFCSRTFHVKWLSSSCPPDASRLLPRMNKITRMAGYKRDGSRFTKGTLRLHTESNLSLVKQIKGTKFKKGLSLLCLNSPCRPFSTLTKNHLVCLRSPHIIGRLPRGSGVL